MPRAILTAGLMILSLGASDAAEVVGKVSMPDSCSPAVSPAVVILEPVGGDAAIQPAPSADPARLALINQRTLQFVPRIQAMQVGQTLRFTNEDTETHNVHILSRETLASNAPDNQSMAPGVPMDVPVAHPGVMKIVCDVHTHMRAYVVVSGSPWVKVCNRDGGYRFRDVPPGTYKLKAWHEMGDPVEAEVVVGDAPTVELPTVTLTASSVSASLAISAPVLPWAEVIDRISLKLGEAMDAVRTPEGARRARKLTEDAYFEDFELSEMERAIRNQLGFERAGEIEGQFRKIWPLTTAVANKQKPASELASASREVLLTLVRAGDDLNRRGVTSKLHIGMGGDDPAESPGAVPIEGVAERRVAFSRALERIRDLADGGDPSEAASLMAETYFAEFEPIERLISTRRPQDVRPLELLYASIRTEIGGGLKGEPLRARLSSLRDAVDASLDRIEAQPTGAFGPAFVASLITILREGVEVILLLTMLITLVIKTGQPGAMAAIRWGVGAAVVASLATAVALNRLVASAQGQTQEMLEGLVMLAASGVLFYVSYWLISQVESKRWLDFLKDRARRGAELGGYTTLGLTAFLAVYREGAETALLYQALIAGQSGAREGLMGLAAGVAVGLVLLAGIYVLIRRTSVKLPLRSFFQVTGLLLFAMAVVFAGNGVFELQQARVIRSTPVSWFSGGVPLLGIYPNVQALGVQALLLVAAALAWVMLWLGRESAAPVKSADSGRQTTAGVGA